jgi:hypothetical protein
VVYGFRQKRLSCTILKKEARRPGEGTARFLLV